MGAKVSPIPEGCHTVTPHLVIKGAGKAIDFYKKAFGAEELFRMPGPDGTSVCHAELQIGNSRVFLADECAEMGVFSPAKYNGSPVTIHLYVEDCDKVFKQATAAGATVTMPLTDMFWGDRFGKLKDPFGHDWSVATHKEDVPPQEMAKRAAAAFSGEKCSAS